MKKRIAVLLCLVWIAVSAVTVFAEEPAFVMVQDNIVGTWTEEGSGRLRMQIIPGKYKAMVDGGSQPDLFVRVNWSSSASEEEEFAFSLYRVEGENAYTYENGTIEKCTYAEDGTKESELLTDAASGTITIRPDETGTPFLIWEDSWQENCASQIIRQISMGLPGEDRPLHGPIDYTDASYWISLPYNDGTDYTYDVFMLEPTVNLKDLSASNENILDAKTIQRFELTFNLEKGILGERARIFSPLYRQKTMGCYLNDPEDENAVVQLDNIENVAAQHAAAYQDVKDAFLCYLENYNNGKPFVLFGYSQGAEMILDLLKEMSDDERIENQMVAAYLIGWNVTEEDVALYPHLKMAQGADDTGVIIAIDCIDERAERPESHVVSINPLNWKTDSTPAGPEENLGYVTVDTDGVVTAEIPGFCGAYLDPETGALLITDMDEENDLFEQEGNPLFRKGYYHLYDLNIFWRNLQKNIADRVKTMNQR